MMSESQEVMQEPNDVTQLKEKQPSIEVTEVVAHEYISVVAPDSRNLAAPADRPESAMSSRSQKSTAKSSAARSGDGATSSIDRNMTDSEVRKQQLLSDVGVLVKHQDRVILQRVQAQIKREALKHLRNRVAEQYDKIANLLQEFKATTYLLDLVQLANYQGELETARNELGPAEEEFSNLEIQLVNEEAKLRKWGDQIITRWRSFPVSERGYPMSSPDVREDESLTEFAFASSTADAERTPDQKEQPVENDNDPTDFLVPFSLHSRPSALEVGPNSLVATQATSGRRAEDLVSSRQEQEISIRQAAPDLSDSMQSIEDAEEPELYVHADFAKDLPELAGADTNTMEHLEPILIESLPKHVASVLKQFGKLATTNQALRRWAMHHLRKSAHDMVVEYRSTFDTNRLEAIIRLSDPDQDDWIAISIKECSEAGSAHEVKNSRPKRAFAIWW